MANPLSLTLRKSILYQIQSVYRLLHFEDPYDPYSLAVLLLPYTVIRDGVQEGVGTINTG